MLIAVVSKEDLFVPVDRFHEMDSLFSYLRCNVCFDICSKFCVIRLSMNQSPMLWFYFWWKAHWNHEIANKYMHEFGEYRVQLPRLATGDRCLHCIKKERERVLFIIVCYEWVFHLYSFLLKNRFVCLDSLCRAIILKPHWHNDHTQTCFVA